MSVFYGGATSALLLSRAHKAELDRRLQSCGLLAAGSRARLDDSDHEDHAASTSEEVAASTPHPVDELGLIEERFEVQRVSEAEEMRRYFAPFEHQQQRQQ